MVPPVIGSKQSEESPSLQPLALFQLFSNRGARAIMMGLARAVRSVGNATTSSSYVAVRWGATTGPGRKGP